MNRAFQICCVAATIATLTFGCGGPQKSETTPTPAAPSASSAMPAMPASAMPAASATPEPAPAPVASSAEATPAPADTAPLIVSIEPKSGSKLKGTAKFEPTSDGVKVTVDVSGIKPGKHGAHIHQFANCSAKDAKSAGGHFNPENYPHGLPPNKKRHLGDLGNIDVGKDGKGHLEILIEGANLKPGDKMSFLDRSIIIHQKKDDGSQPAGNAGKRIGCGEIKR
jgi:superoxide dismutase, Cu-Zn family